MKRFLQWRKMTWVIVIWGGAMLVWLVTRLSSATDAVAGCASDSAGVAASALTRQECLDAAGLGTSGSLVLVGAFWLFGTLALSLVWFMTRPLWRHGHGRRLRRLRPADMPWLYSEPPIAKPKAPA